jgi:hypothetical protein
MIVATVETLQNLRNADKERPAWRARACNRRAISCLNHCNKGKKETTVAWVHEHRRVTEQFFSSIRAWLGDSRNDDIDWARKFGG